jgi:hypothetical protein
MREVRLDYLLEEEFSCSHTFAQIFFAEIAPGPTSLAVENVIHSLSNASGETDLAVVMSVVSGTSTKRLCLLIENKVTAGFQPKQAERYHSRGQKGAEQGDWDEWLTVLVAPESYRGSQHGFQHFVSLETVRAWLSDSDMQRLAFRRGVIDKALKKKANSGVKVVDQAMTRFRLEHFEFVEIYNSLYGSSFRPPKPRPTYDDDNWFEMTEDGLPSICDVRHLSRFGRLELRFKNQASEELRSFLANIGPSDAKVVLGGRHKQHTSLQLSVEPISDFSSFAAVELTVREVLDKARLLCDVVGIHRQAIDHLIQVKS